MTDLKYFLAACICLGLYACGSSPEAEPEETASQSTKIQLTTQQMEMAGIDVGKAGQRRLNAYLECTGQIEAPPQSKASVHSPIQGFIQDVRFLEGDYVQKGTVLAVIAHPDLIRIQREFLESKGRLAFLEQDLQRKESLAFDDAIARKDQIRAASDFQIEQAHYKGLRAELEMIGLPMEAIEKEGVIQQSLNLRAPMSGHITGIHTHLGELAAPGKALYEMIDPGHLHVELQVFAKDAHLLRPKQEIECWIPGSEERFLASVHLVGKEIDQTTKTVRVHGHFAQDPKRLLPGAYVQARIATASDSVWALPQGAIALESGVSMVYVLRNGYFEPVEIKTGRQDGGFIEVILPPGLESETLAVKGAYYLKGAGAGEEE